MLTARHYPPVSQVAHSDLERHAPLNMYRIDRERGTLQPLQLRLPLLIKTLLLHYQ